MTRHRGLDLGALTTHREIELWDVIKKHYRAMFEGLLPGGLCPDPHPGDAGGQHLQRRALGGQHRPHAGPRCPGSGCWPCWRAGDPLHNFYLGLKKLDLRPDELLARIRIPAPPAHSGSFYIKYTRRDAMDLALLGVSTYVELTGDTLKTVRIALTTAAPTPIRAFETERILTGRPAVEGPSWQRARPCCRRAIPGPAGAPARNSAWRCWKS